MPRLHRSQDVAHRSTQGDGPSSGHTPHRSRWLTASWLFAGILALCWLVLRSGTKPSRFAYPCQQAAASTVALSLGLPLTGGLLAFRRGLSRCARTPLGVLVLVAGLLAATVLSAYFTGVEEYAGLVLAPTADYRAKVFHVSECPEDPVGERFVGLDNLLALMGWAGVKFYESQDSSLVGGPQGIIAADDVVIIKINYQWGERGGTNVDLLRGLIRRILDHPDTFVGEVVVCENAQFNPVSNFDRAQNNAQEHALSPHDVVVAFQQAGHNVSHYDWTSVRFTQVAEYSDGDTGDGYVVYPYDDELHGRISYPKFRTASGTYVSLRHGIWSPGGGTYDREHLKFINVPVLKSHHAVYGATACIKNYMGVVTDELGTNSHPAIHYGILGALLGEIQPADLNLLDCIWINANPYDGPWTSYAGATRRNELVASLDPVAADIWAAGHILIPAFAENGYMPPWPFPSADPEDPTSSFRKYLDNSMSQILSAGYAVTNDPAQIDSFNGSGSGGDFDGDGDVDGSDFEAFAQCFTGEGGGPLSYECVPGDFDADGDVDCADWGRFCFVWTEPTPPPELPECSIVGVNEPGRPTPSAGYLAQAYPNPAKGEVTFRFRTARPGEVTLRVFDASGRVVRTLVDDYMNAGEYNVTWDRKSEAGKPVGSGVFFYQVKAPGLKGVKKVLVVE